MTFEDDWLMRQMKGIGDLIGTALHLQIQDIDLGLYEDEEGRLVNGLDYFQQLLKEEKFQQAENFVHSQMKRLPLHQYEVLVDVFISHLKSLDQESQLKHDLTEENLQRIEQDLQEFKW